MSEAGLSFAGLLRQLQAEAQLTEEELAEAAEISPRSVSDLDGGIMRWQHELVPCRYVKGANIRPFVGVLRWFGCAITRAASLPDAVVRWVHYGPD